MGGQATDNLAHGNTLVARGKKKKAKAKSHLFQPKVMMRGAAAAGGQNVFVYGSLVADDVVRLLLKRLPRSSPALLPHFHRFSIKGRVYPAIVPVQNKDVSGQVLLDITDAELAVLDAFEDVEYERQLVEVTLTGGRSEKLHAYTYVWGNKNDPDLYGEWDFEEWKKNHIIDFLKMSKDFVEELGQPDSRSRIAMFFEERRYGK